ncbi:MAG TPA: DUF4405 domain-containing protein [Sumerlaeia bacterium]|nr:DUF4405 domain-containing protein [Sumerlaeia bacterium]
MSRSRLNFVVDAASFVAFAMLTATGILVRYVLPPGSGRFRRLWSLDRHGWGAIHFWVAVVFLSTLAIHLLLHWRWIVCMVRGRPREGSGARVALAVTGVLGLLGIAISPFLGSVEYGGEPPHRMRIDHEAPGGADRIEGSMTFRQVEELTGVPALQIIHDLGLPSDVSLDEHLGRLRRRYKFEMEEVREIVVEYAPP